jgi:hypothetical protein
MKAGFGKEQIFIKKKLELTGFKRGRISNKTLDGIFCRAILLEDKKKSKILFLSIDLLFIGRSLSNKIKEKIKRLYKISEENICITATHTHSAPKTCENFLDGIAVNNSFFNVVVEKSCKAVSLAFKFKKSAIAEIFQISDYPAINRRLPVPLALKLFPNYFRKYCINRPNKKVVSDKSCQGIKFTLEDKNCFWLINGAAHATNYNGNKISSDYPYYIEKHLIELSDKDNCIGSLFLQGWAGDQNCELTKKLKVNQNPLSFLEKIFIKQTFDRSPSKKNLEYLGKKIAKSLLKAEKKKLSLFNVKKVSLKKIELSLENGHKIFLNLRYFYLGDVKIFIFNGEVFSSYRKLLLEMLKEDKASNIFTVGYMEDPIGYIPDLLALKIGGYETDRSISYFGLNSRFASSIQDKIISSLKSIL